MADSLERPTSLKDHKFTGSKEAVKTACTKGDVTFLADLADALAGGSEETENPSEDGRMLKLLKHSKLSLPTAPFTPDSNSPPASLSPPSANMNPRLPHTNNSHQGKLIPLTSSFQKRPTTRTAADPSHLSRRRECPW